MRSSAFCPASGCRPDICQPGASSRDHTLENLSYGLKVGTSDSLKKRGQSTSFSQPLFLTFAMIRHLLFSFTTCHLHSDFRLRCQPVLGAVLLEAILFGKIVGFLLHLEVARFRSELLFAWTLFRSRSSGYRLGCCCHCLFLFSFIALFLLLMSDGRSWPTANLCCASY